MKEEQWGSVGDKNLYSVANITHEPKGLTSAAEAVQYDD